MSLITQDPWIVQIIYNNITLQYAHWCAVGMKLELQCYISHIIIRHTFAEHSVRFCLINLLNKDTRSATIMDRVDTDPFLSFKFS